MTGPIEETAWPEELTAHVVDASGEPRVHGYAVESDLASHYTHAEVALLAMTGELPAPEAARAFELAAVFLAGASLAEAPLHAARLSRVCGAPSSGTIGVAAVGLAEQARHVVASHRDLLSWLAGESSGFPERHRSQSDVERESVGRLAAALRFPVPGLQESPSRTAALLCVLWAAGLRSAEQLELAWTLARLPVAVAEARAVPPAALRQYPMNTPPFVYEP